jgi:hypothetical protein
MVVDRDVAVGLYMSLYAGWVGLDFNLASCLLGLTLACDDDFGVGLEWDWFDFDEVKMKIKSFHWFWILVCMTYEVGLVELEFKFYGWLMRHAYCIHHFNKHIIKMSFSLRTVYKKKMNL